MENKFQTDPEFIMEAAKQNGYIHNMERVENLEQFYISRMNHAYNGLYLPGRGIGGKTIHICTL